LISGHELALVAPHIRAADHACGTFTGQWLPPRSVAARQPVCIRCCGTVKKCGRQNDLQAAKGDLAGVVPPARVMFLH